MTDELILHCVLLCWQQSLHRQAPTKFRLRPVPGFRHLETLQMTASMPNLRARMQKHVPSHVMALPGQAPCTAGAAVTVPCGESQAAHCPILRASVAPEPLPQLPRHHAAPAMGTLLSPSGACCAAGIPLMQESFSLLIWGFIHQEEPDFEAAEEVLESMQQTELRWECREAWVSCPPAFSIQCITALACSGQSISLPACCIGVQGAHQMH